MEEGIGESEKRCIFEWLEKKREDAAREMGRVRGKKREREKGRLAEGRENPGREGGRAGIVAPCLA